MSSCVLSLPSTEQPALLKDSPWDFLTLAQLSLCSPGLSPGDSDPPGPCPGQCLGQGQCSRQEWSRTETEFLPLYRHWSPINVCNSFSWHFLAAGFCWPVFTCSLLQTLGIFLLLFFKFMQPVKPHSELRMAGYSSLSSVLTRFFTLYLSLKSSQIIILIKIQNFG